LILLNLLVGLLIIGISEFLPLPALPDRLSAVALFLAWNFFSHEEVRSFLRFKNHYRPEKIKHFVFGTLARAVIVLVPAALAYTTGQLSEFRIDATKIIAARVKNERVKISFFILGCFLWL
jgi:hypothetical protein